MDDIQRGLPAVSHFWYGRTMMMKGWRQLLFCVAVCAATSGSLFAADREDPVEECWTIDLSLPPRVVAIEEMRHGIPYAFDLVPARKSDDEPGEAGAARKKPVPAPRKKVTPKKEGEE